MEPQFQISKGSPSNTKSNGNSIPDYLGGQGKKPSKILPPQNLPTFKGGGYKLVQGQHYISDFHQHPQGCRAANKRPPTGIIQATWGPTRPRKQKVGPLAMQQLVRHPVKDPETYRFPSEHLRFCLHSASGDCVVCRLPGTNEIL